MKAGLLARVDNPQAGPLVAALREALAERGVEVLLEKRTAALLGPDWDEEGIARA